MKFKQIAKNKSYFMIITIFLIVSILFLIKFLIKNSYAYYSSNNEISIISSTIGGFSKATPPVKVKNADINVLIFLQDQYDQKKYNQADYIPAFGYQYNSKKSKCNPSGAQFSTFNADNEVITIVGQEETYGQIICEVYYDINQNSDLVIYILLEDPDYGTISYNDKMYLYSNDVPNTGYDYDKTICTNEEATSITYNESSGLFEYTTTKPNTCYAYFNKKIEEG